MLNISNIIKPVANIVGQVATGLTNNTAASPPTQQTMAGDSTSFSSEAGTQDKSFPLLQNLGDAWGDKPAPLPSANSPNSVMDQLTKEMKEYQRDTHLRKAKDGNQDLFEKFKASMS